MKTPEKGLVGTGSAPTVLPWFECQERQYIPKGQVPKRSAQPAKPVASIVVVGVLPNRDTEVTADFSGQDIDNLVVTGHC